ncbi:glycoside hydrolase family 25 protein [Brevibacterium moorei]|uniref:glycoside hydrolase family 25 protein n=1 Tax=Brevibacterium moorei TaxID=2968457 RepID=UPI00211CFA8F|nr:glycoside hydrolase family 25 protein [Brevibacterium sp. 68QC2CO]
MSHWESGLNLAKSGQAFVIVKLTEGTTYVDPTAAGYIAQAQKAGIPVGIYHFARGGSIAEAKHFLKHARPYLGKAVLILDWEDKATEHDTAAAKRWLDYVKAQTGVTPWLYTYRAVELAHDWSKVAKLYPLWVARYNSVLGTLKHWARPIMWQYTESYRLQGHTVDANHYYGSRADWAWYAAKH